MRLTQAHSVILWNMPVKSFYQRWRTVHTTTNPASVLMEMWIHTVSVPTPRRQTTTILRWLNALLFHSLTLSSILERIHAKTHILHTHTNLVLVEEGYYLMESGFFLGSYRLVHRHPACHASKTMSEQSLLFRRVPSISTSSTYPSPKNNPHSQMLSQSSVVPHSPNQLPNLLLAARPTAAGFCCFALEMCSRFDYHEIGGGKMEGERDRWRPWEPTCRASEEAKEAGKAVCLSLSTALRWLQCVSRREIHVHVHVLSLKLKQGIANSEVILLIEILRKITSHVTTVFAWRKKRFDAMCVQMRDDLWFVVRLVSDWHWLSTCCCCFFVSDTLPSKTDSSILWNGRILTVECFKLMIEYVFELNGPAYKSQKPCVLCFWGSFIALAWEINISLRIIRFIFPRFLTSWTIIMVQLPGPSCWL